MAAPVGSTLVDSQFGAFFHMWSQNSWTSFTEHVIARLTVCTPDTSSFLGKLVVSRTNGTPMTSCLFPFPIDNVSWKFLQNSTKVIVINETGSATSKILLDMDTKTEANNLLGLLQHYSSLARQNASQNVANTNTTSNAARSSDVSLSVDETMANFDDPSTSILDDSTASFSDFIFGQGLNNGTVLGELASAASAPGQGPEEREATVNFVSAGTDINPFLSLPQNAFDTPNMLNFAHGSSTLDTTHMEALPHHFAEESTASHHPALNAYYERLGDAWLRWDMMTQAEKALWTPED